MGIITSLHLGDIHLYHSRTPTLDILKQLEFFLNPNNEIFNSCDIIFIQGDLFDKKIDVYNRDFIDICFWFTIFLEYCSKHRKIVRVLEGTRSHDWKQFTFLLELVKIKNIKNIDIKYITDIHIEYLEKYNINILYVPDDIAPSADKAMIEIYKQMKINKIEKVDLAIMHGYFDFQQPRIKSNKKYSSEIFSNIVKHYTLINHFHTHKVFNKIIAPGSFDRLAHGEEEKKGFIKTIINTDNPKEDNYFFIENKEAKIYKTINCDKLDFKGSLEKIIKIITKLKNDSFIRIAANKNHDIFSHFDDLVRNYPLYNFSKLYTDTDKTIDDIDALYFNTDEEYKPFIINENNLHSLINERLTNKRYSPTTIDECLNILQVKLSKVK